MVKILFVVLVFSSACLPATGGDAGLPGLGTRNTCTVGVMCNGSWMTWDVEACLSPKAGAQEIAAACDSYVHAECVEWMGSSEPFVCIAECNPSLTTCVGGDIEFPPEE